MISFRCKAQEHHDGGGGGVGNEWEEKMECYMTGFLPEVKRSILEGDSLRS